jgi:RNA polymerase sigma factor (TIGR02999 family)
VHEAYLRLTGSESREWDSNGHFFAAAAQAMREILVREARRKSAAKRGGGRKRVELDEDALAIEPPSDDMLELDDALGRLEKAEPWKARIVMLRYFAGLTTADTAKLLGTSTATVEREWRYIRAWLARELAKGREKS